MRQSDIGDDSDFRFPDAEHPIHFADMVDTHLEDTECRIRFDFEYGYRKSDLRIEVSGCLRRFSQTGKNGGDHLFGRGLPAAAGDSDTFHIGMGCDMVCSHALQGSQRIIDYDKGFAVILDPGLDAVGVARRYQRGAGSRLESIEDIVVAIGQLSRQCHKQRSFDHFAGIDGDG
jgi:hypothetical protein